MRNCEIKTLNQLPQCGGDINTRYVVIAVLEQKHKEAKVKKAPNAKVRV